ncbi:MAG: hypothetical protein KDC92_00330 [Bacteroidetes bacterium]|nr:hypothetical protein [Bacteroidota bacterium]
MRLSFITLLLLAATGFLSCQDEIEMPRPEMERLIGTWRLYQVHSSWSGIYNTDSTGQQVVLKFRKNGIFTQKKSRGSSYSFIYSFEIPESYQNESDYFFINYEPIKEDQSAHNIGSHEARFYGNDTLYLSEHYIMDGSSYLFYRD